MYQPSKILLETLPPSLDHLDLEAKAHQLSDKKQYKKQLKHWQTQLLHIQQAYFHQGRNAIIVMQGWDASGKGGAIRRLTEKLDPRGFQVHPIAAPNSLEAQQHYLQRFAQRLPQKGSIAIFDRSWYERVLVERVEGFATEQEWQRAYQEINEFERTQLDNGTRIVKLFLHISPQEQLNRFEERLHNPVKQWKLTAEDLRNRKKWPDYQTATNDMFSYTSTQAAPWHLIAANKKWYARTQVLQKVVEVLAQDVNLTPPPLDEALVKAAEAELGVKVATR